MNAPSTPGQLIDELSAQALALPLVSKQRFAVLVGVPEGVVDGWIQRGYIPTYSVGKYTLVNLSVLNQMALMKAPWL